MIYQPVFLGYTHNNQVKVYLHPYDEVGRFISSASSMLWKSLEHAPVGIVLAQNEYNLGTNYWLQLGHEVGHLIDCLCHDNIFCMFIEPGYKFDCLSIISNKFFMAEVRAWQVVYSLFKPLLPFFKRNPDNYRKSILTALEGYWYQEVFNTYLPEYKNMVPRELLATGTPVTSVAMNRYRKDRIIESKLPFTYPIEEVNTLLKQKYKFSDIDFKSYKKDILLLSAKANAYNKPKKNDSGST